MTTSAGHRSSSSGWGFSLPDRSGRPGSSGFALPRSTALALVRTVNRRARSVESTSPPTVRVGQTRDAYDATTDVRTGATSTSTVVTMAVLAGLVVGGGVLLVTAKPLYALGGLLAGLFVGSRLASETGGGA